MFEGKPRNVLERGRKFPPPSRMGRGSGGISRIIIPYHLGRKRVIE
jgi:hypothetical protein